MYICVLYDLTGIVSQTIGPKRVFHDGGDPRECFIVGETPALPYPCDCTKMSTEDLGRYSVTLFLLRLAHVRGSMAHSKFLLWPM